ncbi:unnamed protein product [Rotaria sp. Silwood1]|nr:unnamed protein product [Rotaria sp. Silwood1]CAF4934257.1 unnamed protein product [Rotaria sp. Silwood1]
MSKHCTNFNPSVFKPNICRDCFLNKEYHQNSITSIQTSSCHKIIDNNDQYNQNKIDEDSKSISFQINLPPCKYGLSCDRTNSNHFECYSHPSGYKRREKFSEIDDIDVPIVSNDSPVTECELKLRKKLEEQKKSELHFIELIQSKVENLIVQLELKTEEITKLRQDLTKLITYNKQLEIKLEEEIDYRKQRELERKKILAIPRQTPIYWRLSIFQEPYREIELSTQSFEFDIIKQLINSTISQHNNKYGTVNGQNPTKFLIKKIVRIHNDELWHLYSYKKDMIIRQNNDRLADCGSSIYLETHPILTPLLDARTNEYWLFHGCSQNNLYHLLHSGYDPRISNLKGKFGGGFYLAENSSKSNRYIPCPGDVDSVMGENKKNGGNLLDHREFILYDAGQAYPEYVIYFHRSSKNVLESSNIEDFKIKCLNFLTDTF